MVASPAARLVVLGCEVYGQWCEDAVSLIRQFAKLKSREVHPILQKSAEYAWSNRWWDIVGIGIQRGIAESLLCENGTDLLSGGHDPNEAGLADVLSEF